MMTIQQKRLPRYLGKYLISLILIATALSTNPAQAANREEIDAYVKEALNELYNYSSAGKSLTAKAKGILIFPRIYKVGIVLGGEYGEGALLIKGENVGYYKTMSVSIGLQLGAQRKTQVILFMTDDSLEQFRRSKGWEVGIDGSVAIANIGAGEDFDTHTSQKPIIGIVFSNQGLMFNLNLEGSKITKIQR